MSQQLPAPYADLLRGLLDESGSHEPEQALREMQASLTRFRLEYSCGMEEIATKIDILRQEFEHTHPYGPIEHVKTRLKSMESLVAKMAKIDCPPDLEVVRERIRDIAGIRVTCAFIEDTYRVAEMLTRQPDLVVVETEDYIANPKPNGYQSLHLIVEVPVYLSDRSIKVPVELQLRTIAMDFWASVEHRIYYKYAGVVPADLSDSLREVAVTAADLDRQMTRLREEVQSLAVHPYSN